MVAVSTLTFIAIAFGVHFSHAAPSQTSSPRSPRTHVEKRELSSWITLLKDSVVSDVACATSCVSWLADAAVCAGESTLTDTTYVGCMCETDNLAAWVSCASCYVDHMTDGTQQQATLQQLESDYLSECGSSLPLTVTFSDESTATSLAVYTAPTTIIPESLTRATTETSSLVTSSTSTIESSTSSTSSITTTSTATASTTSSTQSSTSTSSAESSASSSADLSPLTVTSTATQGAPTTQSSAAGAATTVDVASGAERVVGSLGAFLGCAIALML